MTPADEDAAPINWSIRLVTEEADQWDDLLFSLRKETSRRTLSKADIMRALIELASNDPTVRSALIAALTTPR
ncbi:MULTISPECIES: hypothetical protein [unclassified Mycolicibacterium]|uniref:hypothetical protein n=1 Tax=unclassified Mycolicibacterium TaxID=2636767 RepID=UPI001BB2EF8D|nr:MULTISPECIES: hypothetical protein [unclassified Mycolicibacterium]